MDHPDIDRPDPALMGRIAPIATSTFANAFDKCRLFHSVMADIPAVAPGFALSGPAVTVKLSVGEPGTYTSEDFAVGAMIDAAKRGDVIVIDGGGSRFSTWGGMASFAAKMKGVAGIVVDGAARDLEEMIEFDFAVFSRHMVPTTGRTRLKVEAINVPVRVGGIDVNPGDIIVGDGTGVIAIPKARAQEVTSFAEKCQLDDNAAMEDMKNGLTFSQAMAKYRNI